MKIQDVLQALKNADAAGDTEAATQLAQLAVRLRPDLAPAAPAPEAPARESTIGSEFVRGAKQFGSSIQTGIGALANPEEAAQAGIERGRSISEEAGEGPSLARTKQAFETDGILGAAKEVGRQIPRAISGQLPQLGALAAGAKLGAMAGTAVAPGLGTIVGGALGAGATLLPSFFGSNVERQAGEQIEAGQPVDINRGTAALAATGQAALEGAGTAFVLGKRVVKGVLGIVDDVALQSAAARAALETTAERSLLAATAQGAAKGLVIEIPV